MTLTDRTLDYSFNLIKKIPADIIDTLSSLKTIYLIQNKISRIAGLDSLAPTLNSLELGGNRIRVSQLHRQPCSSPLPRPLTVSAATDYRERRHAHQLDRALAWQE